MRKLTFTEFNKFHHHNKFSSYVSPNLQKFTHVWLRVDRVRRPLEAPYIGPFKVISRNDKFFMVQNYIGKEDSVSVDRLKPAIVASESKDADIIKTSF